MPIRVSFILQPAECFALEQHGLWPERSVRDRPPSSFHVEAGQLLVASSECSPLQQSDVGLHWNGADRQNTQHSNGGARAFLGTMTVTAPAVNKVRIESEKAAPVDSVWHGASLEQSRLDLCMF